MAFTPGSNDGALNGATPVTLVAAPGAGVVRQVHWISITNKDSAAVTLTLNLINGASTRRLLKIIMAVDDNLLWNDNIILDATDESVEAVLSGAAASTNPDFVASYGDSS